MDYRLKREDRQTVSSGKVLEFMRDTMRLPDGKMRVVIFRKYQLAHDVSFLKKTLNKSAFPYPYRYFTA